MVLLLYAHTHAHAENARIHLTLLHTGHAEDNRGTLYYEFGRYRLAVKIIGSPAEIKRIDLVGEVSNLHRAEDVIGSYAAVASGTTTISGSNKVKLRNNEGIILELHAVNNTSSQIELDGMILESRGWGRKSRGSSQKQMRNRGAGAVIG